jgi:tetratricopeptide (TPR) repeat protein
MVLDPENPEVYWGMGEAERNLGRYAEARKNFETLLDYDPDGKHGKQVRKLLKEPAMASAHAAGSGTGQEAAPQ